MITAIVLTKDEEIHIDRCLKNLAKINCKVKLVDSGSTDNTLAIAAKYSNTEIYYNAWINYGNQFNWAISNCEIDTDWVIRIDADEYLDNDLIDYINNKLCFIDEDVTGIFVQRALVFLNKKISHGSGKVSHLKIWRNGYAYCENKWMDEHMLLTSGKSISINAHLIDCNLKPISDFISKHNGYATREAIDYYTKYLKNNKEKNSIMQAPTHQVKSTYYKAPIFLRCFIFYIYALTIRLGVLDGLRGIIYHTLQKFVYRFIVDAKIYEAKIHAINNGESEIEFLKKGKKIV